MNKHTSLRASGSLLERASEIYDFRSSLRGPALTESRAPCSKYRNTDGASSSRARASSRSR